MQRERIGEGDLRPRRRREDGTLLIEDCVGLLALHARRTGCVPDDDRAGLPEPFVARHVVEVPVGVQEVSNGAATGCRDGGNDLVVELGELAVDDERAALADEHADVAAGSHQHDDPGRDRNGLHFDLGPVLRLAAGGKRDPRRHQNHERQRATCHLPRSSPAEPMSSLIHQPGM